MIQCMQIDIAISFEKLLVENYLSAVSHHAASDELEYRVIHTGRVRYLVVVQEVQKVSRRMTLSR